MRKILLPILIAGTLVGCCALPERVTLTDRHAVLVDTPFSTGSGFPITLDTYLTAAHVVDGWPAGQITVEGMTAKEIIILEGIDAALIVMPDIHGHMPWPIEERAARPGEVVFKSGYGQGLHWWTEGLGTEDPDRVAIDIYPGDSGCPLFDVQGDVIAIVVAVGAGRRGPIMHHCWVVPMTEIVPLLPPDLFEPVPVPLPEPLPVPETEWERFLRLREERGL